MQKKIHPIILIGSSTGGPQVLDVIIPALPADLKSSIVIVQHMSGFFTAELAERLAKYSIIKIAEAHQTDSLSPGCVLVAPGEKNLVINEDLTTRETTDNHDYHTRPSIDATFVSVAKNCPNRIIAIILSGMGEDGLVGVKAIKEAGGYVIVQEPSTCVIDSMPCKIIEAALADEILTPPEIAERIIELSK